MKRIGLYLGGQPYGGGIFQYNQTLLEVFKFLFKNGFDVIVVYSDLAWKKYLRNDLPVLYIERNFFDKALFKFWIVLRLPVGLWRQVAIYIHSFVRKVMKLKCDLWVFPSQDMWSCMVPVPAVVAIHDLMHRYEKHFSEVSARGEYEAREWEYRNMCLWAKAILVDSEMGRVHVHESYGLDLNRINVLPYTLPAYIYSKHVPVDFDQKYPLPKKFIFYPAQFWEHKNHKGLIRAVERLKGTISDLKLVFAGGKKNAYTSVNSLVKELGLEEKVFFLGYVPDEYLPEFYRRARALVMPTFFGPTNIPPLEAMALGCPVAVSRIYAMPDQLGDAAVWFDPNSDQQIAQAIKQLWNDDDLCQHLSQRGLEQIKLWDQTCFNQRFQEILKRI